MKRLLIAISLLFTATVARAETKTLEICNQKDYKLLVAVSLSTHIDGPNSDFRTMIHGWVNIGPGECSSFTRDEAEIQGLYVEGNSGGTKFVYVYGSNDPDFTDYTYEYCVDPHYKFKFVTDGGCSREDRRVFHSYHLPDQTTWNIR